jgi:hypothetical protein
MKTIERSINTSKMQLYPTFGLPRQVYNYIPIFDEISNKAVEAYKMKIYDKYLPITEEFDKNMLKYYKTDAKLAYKYNFINIKLKNEIFLFDLNDWDNTTIVKPREIQPTVLYLIPTKYQIFLTNYGTSIPLVYKDEYLDSSPNHMFYGQGRYWNSVEVEDKHNYIVNFFKKYVYSHIKSYFDKKLVNESINVSANKAFNDLELLKGTLSQKLRLFFITNQKIKPQNTSAKILHKFKNNEAPGNDGNIIWELFVNNKKVGLMLFLANVPEDEFEGYGVSEYKYIDKRGFDPLEFGVTLGYMWEQNKIYCEPSYLVKKLYPNMSKKEREETEAWTSLISINERAWNV